ncbi:hypothetical protein Pcinc_033145 [Petrolisthes cinctipes]|uniref:Uncharacterized protein n=1 Tax=Petrolisthes cinctipes TaxID=88211 RepID=A0AAE1ESZ9_PETCI|nr:hypothetical protein Pcinc_033145 [Petrolisthes cinctipes]
MGLGKKGRMVDREGWKDGWGRHRGWKDGWGVWGVGCRIEGDREGWKDGWGRQRGMEGWMGEIEGDVGLRETERNGRMEGECGGWGVGLRETERDGRMDGECVGGL